jgi:hypothetical protein
MIIDDFDLILRLVRQAGLPEQDEHEILRKTSRRLFSDAPTYCIEREIALRLESQSRPIDHNDLRDMQAFSTVLAYANIVVAESLFANLTIQSGLHKKFSTVVTTDLLSPAALSAGSDLRPPAQKQSMTRRFVECTAGDHRSRYAIEIGDHRIFNQARPGSDLGLRCDPLMGHRYVCYHNVVAGRNDIRTFQRPKRPGNCALQRVRPTTAAEGRASSE